jgi:hypothetical protein
LSQGKTSRCRNEADQNYCFFHVDASSLRACSGFGSEAKESKFYFRLGKICSRMWAIRRKF